MLPVTVGTPRTIVVTNLPSRPANNTSDKAPAAKTPGAFGRLKQDKLSWPVWLAIAYAGVVLPVLCHGSTWSEAPEAPEWQSGDLSDKIGFVLGGSAGYPLYPLMLYPIICLLLLLFLKTLHRGKLWSI